MSNVILYGAAGLLLVIVWSYFKALQYRAKIIAHLKGKHPEVHARVMADLAGMRLLDRLFADFDVVRRQANQERSLLKITVGGDTDLAHLRVCYRGALVATVGLVVAFFLATILVVFLAK